MAFLNTVFKIVHMVEFLVHDSIKKCVLIFDIKLTVILNDMTIVALRAMENENIVTFLQFQEVH
jgi:hypothetical protein